MATFLGTEREPVVVSVHLSAGHTTAKATVDVIELVAGLGVLGDAHLGSTVQHRSRVRQDPTQPNLRQVHLIGAELHAELAAGGFPVGPGRMGENITTVGVDLLGLSLGSLVELGEQAIVAVTGLRNPCGQLDAIQPGLRAAVTGRTPDGAVVRRAGVMGVVVAGGAVRTGDRVRITEPGPPHRPLERV